MTPQDAYLDLAVRVAEIDPAAADYMLDGATKTIGFEPSTRISGAFAWAATPQGHQFWQNLSRRIDL
jgi:hypothetical protein